MIALLKPTAQSFAIPEVSAQPRLPRGTAQNSIHGFHLFLAEASRSSRSFSLPQPGQTLFFKAPDPILYGPRRISQQLGYLRAGHALSHQQHSVKAMIIARFLGATNFILEPQYDRSRVGNLEWSHSSMRSRWVNMRNYLCRYV